MTALMIATEKKQFASVSTLVANGADVNAATRVRIVVGLMLLARR